MDGTYEYVIIGGGLSGASAVEGIRERDEGGSILLLGREPDLPYDRPPLTKQLWFGKQKVDEITVHDRAFYADHGVTLELGRSVVRIDPASRAVVDDLGRNFTFAKLLLATGGRPRRLPIPGGELDGSVRSRDATASMAVRYYRTLSDYREVRARATEGSSALVVGGGFIGSEIAAALSHVGVRVTMIFPEPYLGHRVFPESLGRHLDASYREHGIEVLADDVPTSIAMDGARFVTTTRGGRRVETDQVIAGVGIEPSTELARDAGLAIENGVVVDEHLVTSAPGIFAAGDNAAFPYTALGRRARVEHWDNAITQGKHAGRNMAGAREPYLHMPFFFSDLFDFGYEAVGDVDARLETFADWQEPNRTGVVYYLADGRVRGALMCNVWEKVDAARALIREGKKVSPDELRGAIR